MARPPTQAYVAQGKNGLIKVGCTQDVNKRRHGLQQAFRKKGDELMRVEACDAIPYGRLVESYLIQHCRAKYQRHSGWEWFTGCALDEVFAIAKKITDEWRHHKPSYTREWTEEELAAFRAKHKANKAARLARREADRVEIARRSFIFQAKRHKSERVVAAFVAFASKAA